MACCAFAIYLIGQVYNLVSWVRCRTTGGEVTSAFLDPVVAWRQDFAASPALAASAAFSARRLVFVLVPAALVAASIPMGAARTQPPSAGWTGVPGQAAWQTLFCGGSAR